MNVYIAKITNKENVEKILKKQIFTHMDIYNFENEIMPADSIFFVFSGDKSKIDWKQGLIGFGKILKAPYEKGYNKEKPRYFKIDIEPIFILKEPLDPKFTKLHPKYQNELYDVPYVGANHFPNQAIAKTSGRSAEILFLLMKDIDPRSVEGLNYNFLKEEDEDIIDLFRQYLLEKNQISTVNSYISALNNMPQYLSLNGIECPALWSRTVDLELLQSAANFVKVESTKESGGILSDYNPQSHWNKGWFYSGISNFIKFLKILDINESIIENEVSNFKSEFSIDSFIEDLKQTGLKFTENIITRFIVALLSKPFVLLTGLSGSGKTKLAQSIAYWLTENHNSLFTLLRNALISDKIKSNYEVVSISSKMIELINTSGSTGKIIPIPTGAFYEWYEALVNKKIYMNDDPKEKRHEIGDESIYQKHIHGFYSELFKVAIEMVNLSKIQNVHKVKQYEIISVGSDWTNREPLLGYPNALQDNDYIKPENGALDLLINASENPDIPFFLILDEMNLSHVERYFADFLSSMESNEDISLHDKNKILGNIPKKINLPKNLFIIGTVNIDETTYMFSPKVLDRANVIEFRVSEEQMEDFFNEPAVLDMESLRGKGASMGVDFVKKAGASVDPVTNLKNSLMPFFSNLKKAGAEFGYRTASEISRFVSVCEDISDGKMNRNQIVDAAIMQKLLPKVHGSRNKIEKILKDLGKLCLEDTEIEPFQKEGKSGEIKYPLSYEKLERMHNRVISDGFTSYAEA